MIGLLSLTLALMPLKNVNMQWDLEDPNQMIPDREAPPKTVVASISEQPDETRDLERQPVAEKAGGGAAQIEQNEVEDDGGTVLSH